MKQQTLSATAARARLIAPQDMVSCNLAFIDCKLPGSHLKQNYSFIGPGVTQSSEQVINIPEAHGFNIGAAAMPKGVTNNLHLHFTAEVFLIHEGRWRFRWGNKGEESLELDAPAIVSLPTWIFRGFTNVSATDTDGWVFTVLGGDNTGGIIWHPDVMSAAAEYGLYLSPNNMLIDTSTGAAIPPVAERMPPLPEAEMAQLQHFTPEQMAQFAVTGEQRAWSEHALLDAMLPGHGARMAPVIGYGINQDRQAAPPINTPHGFSVEWLALPQAGEMGTHRCAQVQVLMVFKGTLTVTFNRDGEEVTMTAPERSVISVPAGSWRRYQASDHACEVVITTAGDGRKKLEWDKAIVDAAAALGWGLDPDGYLVRQALLPLVAQRAGRRLATQEA
ncbi:cupin [Pantoea endophytica]|uniref:cupin n=1 Tax=Pantoea endophytica TaxID=92488 RepID=UPI001AE40EED|nr:cupin [Pantoea endophytica]